MQHTAESILSPVVPMHEISKPTSSISNAFDQYRVIRRNGSVVPFNPAKISIAMTKAFIAVGGGQGAASARVRELVEKLAATVVGALLRSQPHGGTLHIEDIQDQVELSLMRSGEHDVARAYVLYREQRTRERAKEKEAAPVAQLHVLDGGVSRPLDVAKLQQAIAAACVGLGDAVEAERILKLTLKDLYDGVPIDEVRKCVVLSARSLIEQEPAYSFVTARLLLNNICCDILARQLLQRIWRLVMWRIFHYSLSAALKQNC